MKSKSKNGNYVWKLTRIADTRDFYLTTDTMIFKVTGLYGPQIQMLKTRPEYALKHGWICEKYDASELAYKFIDEIEGNER